MKRLLILSAFVAANSFAQPFAPGVTTTTTTSACQPCPDKVACPAGCVPEKVKPATPAKPKTLPPKKPKVKPVPSAPQAKEDDCKPTERVVEKTKYVDREVKVDAPKNSIYFLIGRGPDGTVTDRYETRDRPGEYTLRRDTGFLFGLQYDRKFTDMWSGTALVIFNVPQPTFMVGPGIHF